MIDNPPGTLCRVLLMMTVLTLGSVAAYAEEQKAPAKTPLNAETRLLQASLAAEPNLFNTRIGALRTASEPRLARLGQAPDEPVIVEGRDYNIHVRLGAMVSPRTKFIGGVDFTFAGLTPRLTSRVDLEAIASANFGGITTLVPLTFSQVYGARLSGGTRVYGGAGIGPYFGEVTRFGGKLFVGADFTPRTSGEVGVHFAGQGDPLVTVQVRFRL